MILRRFLALFATVIVLHAQSTNLPSVLQPSASPLVTIRILFNTGSAQDPAGQEGIANLTASLIAQGGSTKLTYEQILERMYPLATAFSSQVDKEMTVFEGTTHTDNLQKYYELIRSMILTPGFRERDFARVKSDAINYLKVSLREANDEELGKEHLYNTIYAGHPYGHHNVGAVGALQNLTLEQIKAFYSSNYTRANVVIGLAGGYPAEFAAQVQKDFAILPSGASDTFMAEPVRLESGMRVEIIQRDTRSTAISLGFPIEVRRGDDDYPALALVASWFGQHRSSNSYLYQRLRELRGLNYGNYAYIEYFPRGMYQLRPDPNLGRQQQIFQIWIRPVPPGQALFTFRAALYEYDKLIRDGLTQEAFASTREFLTKYVDVLLQTQDAALGYALDSRYYGIPDYGEYLKDELSKLTLEKVNVAIKRHLKTESMRVVFVTKDAELLKEGLAGGKPSPITYNSPKPEEILAEDKIIENYPIPLKADDIRILPVSTIFE